MTDAQEALLIELVRSTSVTEAHVEHIRARLDTDLALDAARDASISKLEKTAIRSTAYATGFGAAAAFVFSLIKDKILALFLVAAAVFFSGCAGSIETKGLQVWRWYEHEVQYVINQDMEPACVAAAEEGELFWSQLGVDYLRVSYAPGSWSGFNHCPDGAICVTSGAQEGTGGLTWVRTWQHDRGAMAAAEIELSSDECLDVYDGPRVAIHELGHGLGLDDLHSVPKDVKNVMFYALVGVGFLTNEEQREWVRGASSGGATISP